MIAPVPVHCFSTTFLITRLILWRIDDKMLSLLRPFQVFRCKCSGYKYAYFMLPVMCINSIENRSPSSGPFALYSKRSTLAEDSNGSGVLNPQ